jgi:hypothetical protein
LIHTSIPGSAVFNSVHGNNLSNPFAATPTFQSSSRC